MDMSFLKIQYNLIAEHKTRAGAMTVGQHLRMRIYFDAEKELNQNNVDYQ